MSDRLGIWPSVAQVRDWWPDAPEDDQLDLLLGAAVAQCEEYVGTPTSATIRLRQDAYRLAAMMQTRALWQSARSDPSGSIGDDGYQVRLYPMDWTVKNLLRPKSGIPVVA